ncbi:MAG: hypothetical protein AB7P76_10775 [Candidatus Melainabacteria bacterium]
MNLKNWKSTDVANEWSSRITSRMRDMGVADEEINEILRVVYSFVKTAVDIMQKEPYIQLPYTDQAVPLDAEKAHEILDLFLRGVNQCAKRLRDKKLPWETRKRILEEVSWKIFNLAKLLVGSKYAPNPSAPIPITQDVDLKVMMKHSAKELLDVELYEANIA